MDEAAIEQTHLPTSTTLAGLVEENNERSLFAMLRQITEQRDSFAGILDADAFGKIDALKALLRKAKADQQRAQEDQLIAADLDRGRIDEFKKNVVATFRDGGKLRPLMKRLGAFQDSTDQKPDPAIRSWGYNQIDDRGAFIADWYVSYSRWGEAYGDGLARSEDQIAFAAFVDGAERGPDVSLIDLLPVIEDQVAAAKLSQPLVFHSLTIA
jgi:hypothetical protein